jgi:hypothetical protein
MECGLVSGYLFGIIIMVMRMSKSLTFEDKERLEYKKFYKGEIDILLKYIPELEIQLQKCTWDLSRSRIYLNYCKKEDLNIIRDQKIQVIVDTNKKIRKLLDKLCKLTRVELNE